MWFASNLVSSSLWCAALRSPSLGMGSSWMTYRITRTGSRTCRACMAKLRCSRPALLPRSTTCMSRFARRRGVECVSMRRREGRRHEAARQALKSELAELESRQSSNQGTVTWSMGCNCRQRLQLSKTLHAGLHDAASSLTLLRLARPLVLPLSCDLMQPRLAFSSSHRRGAHLPAASTSPRRPAV